MAHYRIDRAGSYLKIAALYESAGDMDDTIKYLSSGSYADLEGPLCGFIRNRHARLDMHAHENWVMHPLDGLSFII